MSKEKLAALLALSKKLDSNSAPALRVAFFGTVADHAYLPHIKTFFKSVHCIYSLDKAITSLAHLKMWTDSNKVSGIVSTDPNLLNLCLGRKAKGYSNYEGSLFEIDGLSIVFIPPLAQLFTVSYGKFLAERFISKIISPASWTDPPKFSFALLDPTNFEEFYNELSSPDALFLAEDIETFKSPLSIRCVGFTLARRTPGTGAIVYTSRVLPLDSTYNLSILRQINSHPIPKLFQNGKYDSVYLLRFNAAPASYLFDTAHMMHSWYSELPKDLAFQNAFFLRNVVYWKDLAETSDLYEYYRYCALDTWATANVWIEQITTAPDWALRNYILEFPVAHACILPEMTGILRDTERLNAEAAKEEVKQQRLLASIRTMLGEPNFNPSSPKQVLTLLKILGSGDLQSSDEKHLNIAAFRHPLNARIIEAILEYRGARKLSSTYLTTGIDAKELDGTILYSLGPHWTDTGRLASKESAFWCGLQIQNIPSGSAVKSTLRAPDDFVFCEVDLEQAESRDTAHISGDEKLIAAVSGTRDFHSVNAAAFFGRHYEDIFDEILNKTKDKPLRDLAKRVNHGANYNMGARVLVLTMGLAKIYEAGRLLKLPYTDPVEIAEHLLRAFHATYPILSTAYYPWIKHEVAAKSKLVSRAFHHTPYNLSFQHDIESHINTAGDWTRYCFADPAKSKPALNAYIAHCPQSLNARTLNEGFLRVYHEVALPNPKTFRLYGQIHDSIPFAFHKDHPEHATKVKELMEIPVTVRGVDNKFRTFTVPAAIKMAKNNSPYWGDCD